MAHKEHKSCIEACVKCAQECEHCGDACLGKMEECARRCIDCAELCWTCAAYMSRGSRLAPEVCQVCADAWDACAEECEKHQEDHCRRCAQACRKCAEQCRKVAGARVWNRNERRRYMQVEKIMTLNVGTCGPQDTLHTAAQIMWEKDCGCVPVLDETSTVVGMLTDRDICMAALFKERPLGELPVSIAMSKNVCVCRHEDTIEIAERTMEVNRVRRLPVINAAGRIVGILSLNDIAREAARERSQKNREVTDGEVGKTLSVLCEPHVRES